MNFKIVVSDSESRKSYQTEIDQSKSGLLGKKIGEKISGNNVNLPGYELQITGGSDQQGFPMRREVEGAVRKRILLSHPPGFKPQRKGQRKRKSIRGNTISSQITQINTKILKKGPKSINELLGVKSGKKEQPKEEKKPVEKQKEEKILEKPKEEKTVQKPEEKMGIKKLEETAEPKEEKKEQPVEKPKEEKTLEKPKETEEKKEEPKEKESKPQEKK